MNLFQHLHAVTSLRGRLQPVKKWIRSCNEQHNCARSLLSSAPELPKRVLDLRHFAASGKLRLLETNRRRGGYICLSYCWGSDNSFVTNETNYRKMKSSIDFGKMPQTYQDAILGGADARDWKEQSARMSQIYGNSYLTISASNSNAAEDGFISRPRALEPPVVFNTCDPSRSVFARKAYNHQPFMEVRIEATENPTRNRAWCFQELILAKRVLHFGPEEIFFECEEDCQCECGFKDFTKRSMKTDFRKSLSAIPNEGSWKPWEKIIEEYSQRHLTRPSDRLPALSGLAKIIGSYKNCNYFAGHWLDSDFFRSLTWELGPNYKAPASLTYVAPSWSFVSTNQYCRYWEHGIFVDLPQNRLVGYQCILDSEDKYGAILGGHIIVKGVLLPVRLMRLSSNEQSKKEHECFIHLQRNYIEIVGKLDNVYVDDAFLRDSTIACWYLGYDDIHEENERIHKMLVLREVSQTPSMWQRIGRTELWNTLDEQELWVDTKRFLEGFENHAKGFAIV